MIETNVEIVFRFRTIAQSAVFAENI